MGWVDALRGMTVGLDTAPLIYYIEVHPSYIDLLDPFFDALDRGELTVLTSYITLLEVLVQPLRRADAALAARYRDALLNASGLRSLPLTSEIAEEAARLRAQHNIRTADAIQLATALQSGASVFLTNDKRLSSIPDMRVLTLDALRANP